MFKRLIKISLLMSFSILSINSCTKIVEDSNPTNGRTTAIFNPDVTYGSMTDIEGNIYKTVTIGTQTWMAENLRTTKYNDSTDIQNVTIDLWKFMGQGSYCNYNSATSPDTIATYGRLYNWYAVNTGKLAPVGWHVPTDAEWTTLTTYLGGESVAGGKLKETGKTHWLLPNTGCTNETGFTALPGGYCNGSFYDIGFSGDWWSATEYETTSARFRSMGFNQKTVYSSHLSKKVGLSVRCVKD